MPQNYGTYTQLFFLAAQNNFTVNVSHIKGTNNAVADALSRLQLPGMSEKGAQAPTITGYI